MKSALAWARSQNLSAEDELSYVREFEHITLARLLLAQGSTPAALALLDRLLLAAEHGGRIGSAIEILLLQAITHYQHGRTPAALASLEHALTLAEPQGYVRIFVDEVPNMAKLLDAAVKRGIVPGYVRVLLPRFGAAEQGARSEKPPIKVEPLSGRELDVLRLLASDLTGPDIARELTLSVSTMRTHTRSIFNKLVVSSRRAAVRRAEKLRLL